MCRSPATPASKQHTSSEPNTTIASVEKGTYAYKLKHTSMNEPSPTSTYGDTIGSSTPATPQDGLTYDSIAGLSLSLRAAKLDPAIQSISGSPMTVNQVKQPEDPPRMRGQTLLSPVQKETLGDTFHNQSTNTSPSPGRLGVIQNSPSWRQSAKESDDVFISNNQMRSQRNATLPNPDDGHATDVGSSPHVGHLAVAVSKETAQRFLPSEACVFVANLMQNMQDEQLEHHVQNAFLQFGECYTKIKRDNKDMPFAFVSYHNVEESKRAITEGRGLPIAGRPCRTEAAKVHRSLYLSMVTGGLVSEAEARDLMGRYGELEQVWYCSPTEKVIYGLPDGIWVKYKQFDECRDAQAGLRDHPKYRLEQPNILNRATPESASFRGAGSSHQSGSPMPRLSPCDTIFSPGRYTANGRSIFVGNLPPSAIEEGVLQIFSVYGDIIHIEIIRKAFANVFAFVDFKRAESAIYAVQGAQAVKYGDYFLRVEMKESSDPASRRGASPHSNFMGGSPNAMTRMTRMIFQQGVLAGMAQAGSQALPPPVYQNPIIPPWFQQSPITAAYQYPTPNVPIANASLATNQSHGDGYTAPPIGHFQQFAQYPHQGAHHSYQYQQQQPAVQPYQWPPEADSDNMNTDEKGR